MPSWRGISDSPIWRDHDVVILTQFRGRERYYELYLFGQDIRHFPRLDDAKSHVERDFGPLQWEQIDMPDVDTYHYYFGWTTEFTDPTTAYAASLPS